MEFVLRKLDEEQRDVQQRLQMVEGSFKALMDSARDVGELCRCGRGDDPETATAARALEQGFARLAASQHVLQEYVRASQTVRGEIARFAAENGDVAEDAEGPQQQALEALLNRSSEQLARFSDAADAAKDADYDYKQHPLYAQFTASLSGKVKEVVGDDGIVVMPNKVNVICPITRKLIVKPVKNPVCGHCYSSAAVREWVAARQGGVVRCPVAGCEAVLRLNGLQPATDVEHELIRLQLRPTPEELAQQQGGSSSQHAPAQDESDVVDL